MIKRINSTSRSKGAVGKNPLVLKRVIEVAKFSDSILDFGAGKDAAHAKMLEGLGLDVTAHDFGGNVNENHDPLALTREYDLVYSSNVLNVQMTRSMLWDVIHSIRNSVKMGGRIIFNYPESTRLRGFTTDFVFNTISEIFQAEPIMVGGKKNAPVWEIFR
jgi:hypothetical protein